MVKKFRELSSVSSKELMMEAVSCRRQLLTLRFQVKLDQQKSAPHKVRALKRYIAWIKTALHQRVLHPGAHGAHQGEE